MALGAGTHCWECMRYHLGLRLDPPHDYKELLEAIKKQEQDEELDRQLDSDDYWLL